MSSEPHSRRVQTLRLIAQLEIQLKEHISERKSVLDKAYLTTRESLQRSYELAILNDWNPEDYDGESQMWKTCFYKPIEEWRRKIRAYSQVIAEAQSKNDAKRVQTSIQDQSKTSTQFHGFLETSTGFYHNLLAKLRAKYGLSLDRSVLSSGSEISGYCDLSTSLLSLGGDTNSRVLDKHRMTIFRILIRLGDLARYQRDLAGFPDADWQASWAYYMDAQRMMPDQGMPYNQLAVLCSYAHDEIGALFFYARSLGLLVPSETGRSNIEVHMRDASMTKYLETRRKYLEAPKRARTLGDGKSASEKPNGPAMSEMWKIFVHGYFGLHNSESPQALERVQAHMEMMLADFDQIVKSDFVLLQKISSVPRSGSGCGSPTFMQMMIYNIFAAWSVSSQVTENQVSNEATRLLLVRRVNLIMQFSLGMLTSLIERFVADSETQTDNMDLDASPRNTAPRAPSHSQSSDVKQLKHIGRLELLPVISVYLHWLSNISTRLICFDLSSDLERTLFEKLQKALGNLMDIVLPHARQYYKHMSRLPENVTPPLPEDVDLFPFLPLTTAQAGVNFGMLSTVHDSDESYWRRCYKIGLFAQRIATDPLLVAATHAPLQDPVRHFTGNSKGNGQNHQPLLPHSTSFNGVFLFTPTQIGDIQGYMTLEMTLSSEGGLLESQNSKREDFQASPALSQQNHSGYRSSGMSPLHSQDFPVTSSGMRHSQQGQQMPIGEHLAKLPSPAFDQQSSLNSALDQLADAMSMDVDTYPPQIVTSLQSPSGARSPAPGAVGPPKLLFNDVMDSTDASPRLSAHAVGSNRQVNFPSAVSTSNASSVASDLPAGQAHLLRSVPVDQEAIESEKTSSYDPWAKFPSTSSHPSEIAATASKNPLEGRSDLELATEAPTMMNNGAPAWNPFLMSQLDSHASNASDPMQNALGAHLMGTPTAQQGQTRPLLFPGATLPTHAPHGPP